MVSPTPAPEGEGAVEISGDGVEGVASIVVVAVDLDSGLREAEHLVVDLVADLWR